MTQHFSKSKNSILEVDESMFGISALSLAVVDTPISAFGSILNVPSGQYAGTLYFDELEDLVNSKYFVDCELDGQIMSLKCTRQGGLERKLLFQCNLSGPGKKCAGLLEFS